MNFVDQHIHLHALYKRFKEIISYYLQNEIIANKASNCDLLELYYLTEILK